MLSERDNRCPACGSSSVASRRTLFHQLLEQGALPQQFAWYAREGYDLYPPKSLFLILLLLVFMALIPASVFWYAENYPMVEWLALSLLALLACLLVDVLSTYRRYREWSRQWLCADCRRYFQRRSAHAPRRIARLI